MSWVINMDDNMDDELYIAFEGNGDQDHCITVYLPEPVEESAERLAEILNQHWPQGDRVRSQPVLVAVNIGRKE